MTFEKFEKLFLAKYPDGHVIPHGKFAGTTRNKKVAVMFSETSKVYEYYGNYTTILNHVGIKCISRNDVEILEKRLTEYKNDHGKPNKFFDFIMDYSEEIASLESQLKNIKESYIIL